MKLGWLAITLALAVAPPVRAQMPRVDTLCAALLVNAAAAGERIDRDRVRAHLRLPQILLKVHAREIARGVSWWAHVRHFFTSLTDAQDDFVSFSTDHFEPKRSPLARRDDVRAVHYRLKTLTEEIHQTPDAASPLRHQLRGADAILEYFARVRRTAGEAQARFDVGDARRFDRAEAERERLDRVPLDRELRNHERWALLGMYGGAMLGLGAWISPYTTSLTPVLGLAAGAGWWAFRDYVFGAVERAQIKVSTFFETRRLDRQLSTLELRRRAAMRADVELAAIDDLIRVVEESRRRTMPVNTVAYHTHGLDLPMPLATNTRDDRPIDGEVIFDTLARGLAPNTLTPRRAQVHQVLHFEGGVPVLTTFVLELPSTENADIYARTYP